MRDIVSRLKKQETAGYDPKLSIRKNAKRMGISPTTVQKIKRNYLRALEANVSFVQLNLFEVAE